MAGRPNLSLIAMSFPVAPLFPSTPVPFNLSMMQSMGTAVGMPEAWRKPENYRRNSFADYISPWATIGTRSVPVSIVKTPPQALVEQDVPFDIGSDINICAGNHHQFRRGGEDNWWWQGHGNSYARAVSSWVGISLIHEAGC